MDEDTLSKLERLAKLKEQGLLTNAEFDTQKAALFQADLNANKAYAKIAERNPVPETAHYQTTSDDYQPAESKQPYKPNFIIIGIGIAALLILVLTNPSLDDHKAKVKTLFMEKAQSELINDKTNKDGFAALGAMLGATLAENMINNMVSRGNYIVFSLTKVSFADESKVIGVGILGNVFITSKVDQIKKPAP